MLPHFSLWTIWSAGFIFLFWIWAGPGERDLFHPLRLAGSIWFGCLFLASLRLLPTISSWDASFWFELTLPLVAFGVGFKLKESFARRRIARPGSAAGAAAEFPIAAVLAVAAACLLIGAVALAFLYRQIGGIPIFAANIDKARMAFFGVGADQAASHYNTLGNKLLYLGVGFLCYAIYLAWLVVILRIPKTRLHIASAWAIVILGTAAYWSQGGRFFVFIVCLVVLLLYNLLRERVTLRQAAAFFAVMVVVLSAAAFFRGNASHDIGDETTALLSSSLGTQRSAQIFTSGYWTMTSSFEVFYRLRNDLQLIGPHPGFLFYGLHSLFPRTNIQAVCEELYSGATITPTFLGEFYGDGGMVGIMLGPLLLGFATAWWYTSFRSGRTVFGALALAMWLSWLAFIPYVNFFSQYITWVIDLLALWALTRLIAAGSPARQRLPVQGLAVSVGP